MGLYRTEAVVLRSRKYRETDSLLTLLTNKKGKVAAIAKGVRKTNSRLRGGVQVFTHNDMLLYEGRSLETVTQSQCLEAFTLLQDDMKAMAAACYWSELIDSLVPEGELDPELFRLTLAGFHLLSLSANELNIRGLEIKLLSLLGYRPVLERCVSCGQSLQDAGNIFFSVGMGGVLCHKCGRNRESRDRYVLTNEVLGVWRQLSRMDLSKMGRLKLTPPGSKILRQVMDEFLLVQLEYPLKSKAILQEIIEAADE